MSVQAVKVTLLTIASGAAVSGPLYVGHGSLVGIQMPASWTAASLTFQASADGATYANVYDYLGAEVTVVADASHYIPLDEVKIGPWMKIRSGTSGTPVNQGADRVISAIVQGLPIP